MDVKVCKCVCFCVGAELVCDSTYTYVQKCEREYEIVAL